jgi:hypothetical protein
VPLKKREAKQVEKQPLTIEERIAANKAKIAAEQAALAAKFGAEFEE